MINETLVDLSRLQFAITAMYHFLFVPLTLGLSFLLAIMESVYVMTGKPIYKEMTQFWGKLFAINFAMGVATGITLEFQFGTNWAYYSHYVGDVFGVPLITGGLMAFFLEATLIGLFFFGWDRISKEQHLAVTWLVAFGVNISALWILIANGWMQHPIGTQFNYATMRMELTNFSALFLNPVAQVKFVHTVASGYVTGSVFMLAISSYYLLNKRFVAFAKRSFAVASGFGLAACLSVMMLGDETGYGVGEMQKVKIAAIEAEWETHQPPASFTLFGLPNNDKQETSMALKIPYILGLLATHSIDTKIIGIKDIIKSNEDKIKKGIKAHAVLKKLKQNPDSIALKKEFDKHKKFLGYGLLLNRYVADMQQANEEHIKLAARNSVPNVAVLFWTFRIMLICSFILLFTFCVAFYYNAKRCLTARPWLLKLAICQLPLPWIAAECGWIVAEYGRQPWVISEILPTFLGTSTLTVQQVSISLGGFIIFYTILLVVELYLMLKYTKMGPSCLGLEKYREG